MLNSKRCGWKRSWPDPRNSSCIWKFKSSEMLRLVVEELVSDFSKNRGAFGASGCLPYDTVHCPRRLNSSATLFWHSSLVSCIGMKVLGIVTPNLGGDRLQADTWTLDLRNTSASFTTSGVAGLSPVWCDERWIFVQICGLHAMHTLIIFSVHHSCGRYLETPAAA